MSKFLTELDCDLKPGSDNIWIINTPLIYQSDLLGLITVPKDMEVIVIAPPTFETDFASTPRIPFIYEMFGDRAHREAVIHDYLYRKDSKPLVTFMQANNVFFEAMRVRIEDRKRSNPEKGKLALIRTSIHEFVVSHGMYWGVVLGGYFSYHKKNVADKL